MISKRLIFMAVITVITLFTTFKKPKIGLFYFLFLLFLRDGFLWTRTPEIYVDWHLPLIVGWTVLIAWIFKSISSGEKIHMPKELIALILLAAVIFLSSFRAPYPDMARYMFEEYIKMIVLVLLIANIIKSPKDLRQMSLVMIALMTFLVLYAYREYKLYGYEIAVPDPERVDRNFFAESIVAVLPLAYMFSEERKNLLTKYLFLGVSAVLAGGVILTYSRGGLLALAIVCFFLFLNSKKKAFMVVSGIIVLMLFLPHIGEKYKDRMSTIISYEENVSANVRILTWKAGIDMMKMHPVLGVGAGNFNPLFPYYVSGAIYEGEVTGETATRAAYTMSIHNIFLQVASETGVTGGALYLLVIASLYLGVGRLNKRNKLLPAKDKVDLSIPQALRVGLIGFCGAGFFLPGAYYGYLYIIFALLMASQRIYSLQLAEVEKTVKSRPVRKRIR